MSDRCPTPADLADLAGLPAGDPGLAHVEECPRCQAIMVSYEAFLKPEGIPAQADLAAARERLDTALDQEIGTGASGQVVRPPWFRWSAFQVRAVAAVAAVLIVVVALSLMTGPPEEPSQAPVLRGGDEDAGPFGCEIALLDAGGYRLSWAPVEGAVSYQVAVFAAGLQELARVGVGSALAVEMEPPPGAAFCRVIALRGGDEIASSAPVYLTER